MADKRPRIQPATAERIDEVRGLVPFEPYVNNALSVYLEIFESQSKRRKGSTPHATIMTELLCSDFFGFDPIAFAAAFHEALEYHRRELDEQAREDEFLET